jgi:hypothetical protein
MAEEPMHGIVMGSEALQHAARQGTRTRAWGTIAVLVVWLALSTACVSFAHIRVETSGGSRIVRHRTFAFSEGTPARRRHVQDRILAAVERELKARDFVRVFGEADIYVAIHVLVDRHSLAELAREDNFEYWSGVDSVDAFDLRASTLVVDLVDAAENRTVWRGVASAPVKGSVEKNLKLIDKTVNELFREFPGR